MAEPGTGRAAGPAIAVLAVALVLLPADAADASCGSGSRVNHQDAECLSASWKNRGVLKKSPYHVRNMCPEYGKVVAKVDLKSAKDRTLHLDDGSQRDGTTIHRIRGISCCSDTSLLCTRSDLVTDEGCVAQFNRVSSAAWTCINETASAAISGENYNCTVTARCEVRYDHVFPQYKTTSITVPWLDLGDVSNCEGYLRRGPCTPPQPDASWLSVSDASAEEAEGASLNFTLTLSQALLDMVIVNYGTSDGTARAGSDYRETSGLLMFLPGQTEKTVSVPVLDDELDEGSETLTMTVWNWSPQYMSVADPTGTGTIFNTDRMPTAWIARFGRTVGEQVLDAVDARMRANPAPGAEMVVRTASDALSGAGGTLAAADSKTTRLRFGFEGSRPFRLGDGSVLTPGIEIGVRRDGGDAENGFGTEIGAGLAWADPKRGLGAELRGRGLLSHEAQGFRQRGLAGALTWNPVAGDRGPRLSLTRTLGVPAQRGPNTPLAPTTLTGPASNEPGNGLGERRLEARFGYGFPAFGGRFTWTPEIAVGLSDAGRDYSLGWRLVRGGDTPDGSALELVVEARRRESASGRNDPPGHAVGVRVMSRF